MWNSIVIAGLQDEKPFLGTISMLGVHFSDDNIATGRLRTTTSPTLYNDDVHDAGRLSQGWGYQLPAHALSVACTVAQAAHERPYILHT